MELDELDSGRNSITAKSRFELEVFTLELSLPAVLHSLSIWKLVKAEWFWNLSKIESQIGCMATLSLNLYEFTNIWLETLLFRMRKTRNNLWSIFTPTRKCCNIYRYLLSFIYLFPVICVNRIKWKYFSSCEIHRYTLTYFLTRSRFSRKFDECWISVYPVQWILPESSSTPVTTTSIENAYLALPFQPVCPCIESEQATYTQIGTSANTRARTGRLLVVE